MRSRRSVRWLSIPARRCQRSKSGPRLTLRAPGMLVCFAVGDACCADATVGHQVAREREDDDGGHDGRHQKLAKGRLGSPGTETVKTAAASWLMEIDRTTAAAC